MNPTVKNMVQVARDNAQGDRELAAYILRRLILQDVDYLRAVADHLLDEGSVRLTIEGKVK